MVLLKRVECFSLLFDLCGIGDEHILCCRLAGTKHQYHSPCHHCTIRLRRSLR